MNTLKRDPSFSTVAAVIFCTLGAMVGFYSSFVLPWMLSWAAALLVGWIAGSAMIAMRPIGRLWFCIGITMGQIPTWLGFSELMPAPKIAWILLGPLCTATSLLIGFGIFSVIQYFRVLRSDKPPSSPSQNPGDTHEHNPTKSDCDRGSMRIAHANT